MDTNNFYIPVSAGSLAHYLGKAIILPACYYGSKPADIQDQLKTHILLSKNKWTEKNECAIEVVLTLQEQTNLQEVAPGSPLLIYNGGIPVSRIISVHFLDQKQSDTIKWNINTGTAYLPDRLIRVDAKPVVTVNIGDLSLPNSVAGTVIDLSERSKRFDILLGGLAFLKAAAKDSGIFPKHYFAVLSHFNSLIRYQFTKAVDQGLAEPDEQLVSIFVNKPSRWSPIQPLIFDEVSTATVESAAKKANVKLEKKYGLIEIESLDRSPNLYMLALLATYGTNKPKNLQDLITNVINNERLAEEKAEEIALIFGLNLRYSGLRNSYNDKQLSVKFRLESLLDYYTIESIYQYTFISQKDIHNFPYLESIAPKLPTPAVQDCYYVLDTPVRVKKKRDGEADFLAQLAECYPEVQKAFESGAVKALRTITKTLKDKDAQIAMLQQLNKQKDEELQRRVTRPEPAVQLKTDEATPDGLERLEFKDLKAIAKAKKVPAKAYSSLKSTQQGFAELIGLIRKNKTLL